MPKTTAGLSRGEDDVDRCWWAAGGGDLYLRYHDDEWGVPVADDRRLFEKVCLEGFQSGLSWLTILRKRDAFRLAFAGFDFDAVARFGAADVRRLLKDAGIVRHRGKIESTINNAKRAVEVRDEFGSLAAYFWRFEPPARERPKAVTWRALSKLSQTPASVAMSRDLRKRGWSFVGPTTLYAFMQATGMVNDHLEGCAARQNCAAARARFVRPGGTPE
jgi:DNA-3-methyladenine glycosylase I